MKFPEMPRDGMPVEDTVVEIINYLKASRVTNVIGGKINSNSGGTTIEITPPPRPRTPDITKIPYNVTIHATRGESSDTYEASVDWGYVCERLPDSGAVLAYHEAANMWDVSIPTKPARFTITPGQCVFVKVHLKAGGSIGEPTPAEDPAGAVVIVVTEESGSLNLAPTATEAGYYHYKLAELVAPVSPATTPTLKEWLTGSHLEHFVGGGTGGSSFTHMWQVTLASVDESGTGTFNVAGGVAVIQGTRVDVADTTVTSSYPIGDIVLKVERDTDSRAIKEGYPPEIMFFDDLSFPGSSEAEEYTVLAEVTQVLTPAPTEEDPSATTTTYTIRQCRNDEICSYELLHVVNGSFALLPFQANSRNSYAPPVPTPP